MALENLTQITSVGISTGITFSGVTTHTGTIKGTDADFTGNVSVGGTLTYEDVTSIESVGIVTALSYIHVGAGISAVGVTTSTGGFVGALTGNVTGTASNASGATGDFSIADKIVHTGDTNTAIRFPSADTITAETGGSEKLRITSTGNIGFGVASPQGGGGDLSILGNKALRWSNSGGTQYGDIYADTSSNIVFRNGSSSTERVRIDSSGLFGVGTSTLEQRLNIHEADSDGCFLKVTNSTTGTGNSDGALFGITDAEAAVIWQRENNIIQLATNNAERLRITSTGLVGINATSPNAELEIQAATDPKIRLESKESGSKRLDLWVDGGTAISYIAADQSASQLAFKTAGSERLRITAGGQVNIGGNYTQTFNALDVTGNIKASARFNANDAVFIWQQNRMSLGNSFIIESQQNTPFAILTQAVAQPIVFGTNSTERLRIKSDGNIGINHAAADTRLSVMHQGGGSATYDVLTVGSTGYGNNTYPRIKFATTGNNNVLGRLGIFDAGATQSFSGDFVVELNTGSQHWTNTTERFRVKSTGHLHAGNPAVTNSWAVHSIALPGNNDSTFPCPATLNIAGATAYNTANMAGGGIRFIGKYDSSNYTTFAHVAGVKENTTSGDYGGALTFHTRTNGALGGERARITSDGHTLFSGLTSNIDTRNGTGISLKSPGGITFRSFGANGSRNWRIRPDDNHGWSDLEFGCAPTDGANDIPDHASDVVLALEGDTRDVVVANGDLLFGTAGKGIVLGDTSNVAAHTLDFYEEGSWTPGLSSTVLNSMGHNLITTGSYAYRVARWVKIGPMVVISIHMQLTSNFAYDTGASSSTSPVGIGGLPAALGPGVNTNPRFIPGSFVWREGGSSGTTKTFHARISSFFNPQFIELCDEGNGGVGSLTAGDIIEDNAQFHISFSYVLDS